ncbi:hypothetical protein ACET44_29160, partial [Pseudomonas aeruginosa]
RIPHHPRCEGRGVLRVRRPPDGHLEARALAARHGLPLDSL